MEPAYPYRREMASKEKEMRLTVALLLALVFSFGLGYSVRIVTTPVAAIAHASSACPEGQHAVVWYTAHAWACTGNSQ